MVYIKRWPSFHAQCLDLHKRSPAKTRYLIKTSPSASWLILKVTNDDTCLKYRTRSSIILNRFEAFTRELTGAMAGLEPAAAGAGAGAAAHDAMDEDAVGVDAHAAAAAAAQGHGHAKDAKGTKGAAAGQAGGDAGAAAAATTSASSSSKKKKKKGGKK